MLAALVPFFAAVLQAASFTCDKAILNIRRISYRTYLAISFPLLVLFDGIIWFIFRPPFSWSLFTGTPGLLVAGTIAILIITNLLYYRALKDDQLSEINVVSLTAAIPIILVNALIFPDERHITLIIPALIASVAVIWAHWEKHRLHFARHTPVFLAWLWFTTPLTAAAGKIILASWSPITLELVRDAAMALILFPLLRGSAHNIPRRGWFLLLATNALSATAWILYFLSYQKVGIVYTGLIFTLQPMLVYFAGVFILRERFVLRKFIAFLVVLASIAAAQIMR